MSFAEQLEKRIRIKLVKSCVGLEATADEVKSMVSLLEQVGKVLQVNLLKGTISGLPEEISNDTEKIMRFLLLVAILDQQAESPFALWHNGKALRL